MPDAAWEALYLRYLVAVIFEVVTSVLMVVLSQCATRGTNNFRPFMVGSKQLVDIGLLAVGTAVNCVVFTTVDVFRAPAWTA